MAAGGTVTLVFTDLVGSTDLIERLGDDAAERVSREHFDTLRRAIDASGGRDIKSLGDGLMAAFPSALAALEASIEMQRATARAEGEPLGLRVGVHAGEPIADGDDLFGQAVVIAKRLCDSSGAGQIRVSGVVRALVGSRGRLSFRDLGPQGLKGIADPVAAFELEWEGADTAARAPPAAGPGTRVELCGALVVEIEGRRVEDDLPGRKGRLLFAYLVLNRERAVRRDELVSALWPDDPPVSPDRALATVLARLRSVLGGELIKGRAELRLALPPSAAVDVADARAALAEADNATDDPPRALDAARSALAVLERPLLPGLEANWVDDARRELGELELRAHEAAAAAALALGGAHLAVAERSARAVVERDAYRESGHALLIRALAAQGNDAAALRAFDDLRVLLREELGETPSAPLRELSERLLAGEPIEPGPRAERAEAVADASETRPPLPTLAVASASGPIFGREADLARVDAVIARAGAGAQTAALVAGEPGIGKTRLAAELAARAYARGMTVLLGRCEEHALASYGPFVEALRHAILETPQAGLAELAGEQASELAGLVPELRTRMPDIGDPLPGDAEAQRLRLFEAVARFLERLARRGGAVLVIEDLHWADSSTLHLLGYLGRGRAPGLAVVLTYRETDIGDDHELRGVLAGLAREPAVERLTLEGLDASAVGSVIEALAERAPEPEVARAIQERTAGNPFFVTEVVRRGEDGDASALPEGVREVVAERVRRLGEATADLLVAGAVCGREFEIDVAARIARSDYGDAVESFEEALAAGLVREAPETPGRGSFAHALVRETLYDRLSATRRADMHRRAAEAIEAMAAGARVAELSHHFDQAVRGREAADPALAERARHYLEAAGDAAVAVHSSQAALAHYSRARVLAASAERDVRSRLADKEGDVCLRLGRFDAARERWEEAVEAAGEGGASGRLGDLRRKLGDVLVESGFPDAAIEQYKAGITLCGQEPSPTVARLYGESAWVYLARGDHMLAVYAAERAVGVTSKLGEPRAASRAHAIFGRVFGRLGDNERARAQLDRALELAREADQFEELRALRSLADHVDGSESRAAEARDLYEQALAVAQDIGDVPAQLDLRAALGQIAVEGADWQRAERLGDESARVVEREGLADRAALPLALAGALAWRAGDLQTAEEQLAAAVETATRIRWWRVAELANWWLGAVHREQDRLPQAVEALEEAARCGQRAGYVERSAELAAEVAGLLAAAEDLDGARVAAGEAVQYAARAAAPAGSVAAREAAAAVAADARDALRAVSAEWASLGRPLSAARALYVAARLARRDGAPDEAELLDAAAAAFESAGVSRAAERVAAG